jgi:L-iditol 2-dehydrogenase
MAKRMGADELIDASQEDPIERVKQLTEGRGAEAVIAAIGHKSANDQGWKMLSDRGRFVLFAAAHPEPEFTILPNETHNRETGVFGVLSGDKQDFYTAARLVRYGLVDLAPLIDAHYPLEQVDQALEHALRPGTYRVLVEM